MQKENIIIHETLDGRELRQGSTLSATSQMSGAVKGTGRDAALKDDANAQKAPRIDPYLWALYILLLITSVLEQFSASSAQIRGMDIYSPLLDHVKFLALGFVVVIGLQKMHYGYLAKLAWPIGVISVGLLLASTFLGENVNGASRAINLAGISIQPPEIIKLSAVIILATILGRNQEPGGVSTKGVIIMATIVVITAGLLWINGLTNTLIMMAVSVSMLVVGGTQWKKLGAVMLVYVSLAGVLYMVKYAGEKSDGEFAKAEQVMNGTASPEVEIGRQETHKNRTSDWLRGVHATDKVTDKNRQAFYARMAQANGGILGRGIGNSRESARLPLAFSDYIFSIIIEDIGFVGGTSLLIVYLLLVCRAGAIAAKCKRAFPAFLILGCSVLIVLQALIHMAISTGVIPVSGQPLPLISKGGTSILVMSAAFGIMLSVSRYAVTNKSSTHQQQAELRELSSDMQAENVSKLTQ